MKRSKHSLSYTNLLSCNMGSLVPIGLTEVLPGDTIQHNTSLLLRCSPLLAPVMHKIDVRIHHWFVPNRLVWDGWEDFITGGPDGMDASEVPTITHTPAVGSLADYMGVPTGSSLTFNALPFRGYGLIWNEWYRDQDLEAQVVVSTADGPDTTTSMVLKNCAWEKDFYTSARPWEQKGPAVSIPLTGDAPVVLDPPSGALNNGKIRISSTGALNNVSNTLSSTPSGQFVRTSDGTLYTYDPNGSLAADLSGVSAVTVNALREAMAIQRYEEARARYGSRYTEYLRYLGVRSSDARLQRPEYLGGGRQTIQFSEVLQTAEGTEPVGTLRGHGIAAARSNRYRRFIEEHGYVHTFLSVRPKTIYAQGLRRTFNRRTKEDYWQREFEHIGQQEVLNKEVKANHASPNGVFGYQDRYDEYRREESRIAGEFRTVLDFWHLARIFATDPALNASFVSCVPTERSFAVESQDVLYIMANHGIQARRLISSKGNSFIF